MVLMKPIDKLSQWDAEEQQRDKQPCITCPDCHRTSYNPNDIREGFCGHCHAWTSNPRLDQPRKEQQERLRDAP